MRTCFVLLLPSDHRGVTHKGVQAGTASTSCGHATSISASWASVANIIALVAVWKANVNESPSVADSYLEGRKQHG